MTQSARNEKGRFFNPWQVRGGPDFLGLLKWWFFSSNVWKKEKKQPVSFRVQRPDFVALEETGKDYVVWLGHSTVIIKTGGKRIITDPVFGEITRWIKRKTPFPIDPNELPPLDYVIISHNHYDHLNTPSIKFLNDNRGPAFICGPGTGEYFKRIGITKFIELDWWETHVDGDLKITSLPAQHWSKRAFSDTNRMLWISALIESRGIKYYWIGDTGYYGGFKEVGEKFGPIDLLMAPIGAYEPRWFMKTNHVNPEETLLIARDVRAKAVMPIHWGTFDLTDEPLWMPIEHLKGIHDPANDPKLIILQHGGSYGVKSPIEKL